MKKQGLLIGIFLLVCLVSSLRAQHYEISLLGIPMAQVSIEKKPSNKPSSITYEYKAKTNRFFSSLYNVNNQYLVTMDSSMGRLLCYRKEISQKNLKQSFWATYTDEEIFYSTGETRVTNGHWHTILSLLLKLTMMESLEDFQQPIDIEGEFYTAIVVPTQTSSNTVEWNIELIPQEGRPLLEKTDIFTSRLADPEAQRSITVDRSRKCIIAARFTLPPYTLTAQLVEDS
ncbi:MAG: hypothetical protein PHE86_05905 [Candidatus Marinimicrobia bacterium]|nr:hypothetical protein [Candidatus Neomarinimicrobiota bacterium]MDD5582787.1 hypothetical protein [Candidatus Neomarinimicrobiota bacterium]